MGVARRGAARNAKAAKKLSKALDPRAYAESEAKASGDSLAKLDAAIADSVELLCKGESPKIDEKRLFAARKHFFERWLAAVELRKQHGGRSADEGLTTKERDRQERLRN